MKKTGLLLVILMISTLTDLKANHTTDSLQLLLKNAKDTSKVKLLCDLCWEFRFLSAEKALAYGQEALSLSESIGYEKGVAQSYNDMGIIYIDISEYSKAISYFQKALEIRAKLHDNSGMASCYNKIGIVYQKQGKLKDALESQIKALKVYEELGQDRWIAYSLNNIAIIHQNLGNLEKSLEYHYKAVDTRLRLNDQYGEGMSYGNIANVYIKMGDTLEAINYYTKALEIFRQTADDEAIAIQLINLGDLYLEIDRLAEAIILLNESLTIREKLGDLKGLSASLIKLGAANIALKNYDLASQYLHRGLALAIETGVLEEQMEGYRSMAKLFELQLEYDSAFTYAGRYTSLKDSVYEKRLKQQIIDVQVKYETEKVEQENELLLSKNKLNEARLQQRKLEVWLLVFVIISIIGVSVFMLYRRRQRQKAILDRAILKHNELRIQAVIDGQEEERRRIARELHDGVGQKLAGIKLNWESIRFNLKDAENSEKFIAMVDMLDNASSEVRSISHQMMPKELEQFGLPSAIEGLLNYSFSSSTTQYNFNHHGLEGRLAVEVELNLFRITQELVSNTIKHADAHQFSLQLLKRKDAVVLIADDDGKGFAVEDSSTFGIGLLNIESRAKTIHASLSLESEPGKGTVIRIRTPLNERN